MQDYEIKRIRTQSNIDFAVDSHAALSLVVAIWIFFITTTLLYTALIQTLPGFQTLCEPSFGCSLLGTILVWVTFGILLTVMGFLVVIPLSMGNNPEERSPRKNFLVMLLTGIYCWVPFGVVEWYESTVEPPYDGTENLVNDPNWDRAQWVTAASAILLLLFSFKEFVLSIIGNKRIRANTFMNEWLSTSNVFGVTNTKKAATRKLNQMLLNAHSLHPKALVNEKGVFQESADRAMYNFVLNSEKKESVAGVFWTYKMIFSRRLFNTEGIWITSRIVITQCAMTLIILMVIGSQAIVIDRAALQAEKASDDLANTPNLPFWVDKFVPNGHEIRSAFYPALVVSCLVMLSLYLLFIPSAVATMLKYRCGEIPSLKSHYFTKYRTKVESVYSNVGNALFGLVGSAYLFFFLVGLVIFLIIWPFSQELMLLVIAWGLGLTITIVLKMVLVQFCRKKFYRGFYRTKPFSANVATLALECWHIGLGGGVLIGRLTQFLLAAAFWVGRIDVPFLSEDVKIVGYGFDYVPTNFVKDLLSHEAHRHPYLERLITMCMVKLKDHRFGSEPGACWRQLFVVALMPWMLKNRVFTEERLQENLMVYAKKLQVLEAAQKSKQCSTFERVEEGMMEMSNVVVDELTDKRKS